MSKIYGHVEKWTSVLLISVLSVLLALFSVSFQPLQASAANADVAAAQDAVNKSQAALEEAQARLDEISTEFESLTDEINELQDQIDALATQVLDAQQAMLDGRSLLSSTALYEYRSGSLSTFVSVILGSADFSELMRNIDYISQIVDQQTEEIQVQKDLRDRFMAASDELTEQKDIQEAKLAELNQKREEANAVVEEASAEVEENSAELEALRKQAEQFIWKSQNENNQKEDENATTVNRTPVVSSDTPVIPDSTDENVSADNGWRTGVASAYGGSYDSSTGAVAITSTGAICDDWSKGVAVSMYMPNYRSYYGKTVEIKYNGMTVYATVNDCGNMDHGARALDLQPGVIKAFGYGNPFAWGLRTVTYRFL